MGEGKRGWLAFRLEFGPIGTCWKRELSMRASVWEGSSMIKDTEVSEYSGFQQQILDHF